MGDIAGQVLRLEGVGGAILTSRLDILLIRRVDPVRVNVIGSCSLDDLLERLDQLRLHLLEAANLLQSLRKLALNRTDFGFEGLFTFLCRFLLSLILSLQVFDPLSQLDLLGLRLTLLFTLLVVARIFHKLNQTLQLRVLLCLLLRHLLQVLHLGDEFFYFGSEFRLLRV